MSFLGLLNAGKTSLLNVVTSGQYTEDVIPTVGVQATDVTIGGDVTIKIFDFSGQPELRCIWELTPRHLSAIVYVVDVADLYNIIASKSELHLLLRKPCLTAIPLLLLGTKVDKAAALSKETFTEQMGITSIADREVSCIMVSSKNNTNIGQVIGWLLKMSKK